MLLYRSLIISQFITAKKWFALHLSVKITKTFSFHRESLHLVYTQQNCSYLACHQWCQSSKVFRLSTWMPKYNFVNIPFNIPFDGLSIELITWNSKVFQIYLYFRFILAYLFLDIVQAGAVLKVFKWKSGSKYLRSSWKMVNNWRANDVTENW